MTTFKTRDGQTLTEHQTFARYHAPCGLVYVSLVTGENQSKRYILGDLKEVEAPPVQGCEPPPQPEHTCALPPYMVDNIIALTEILNTRPKDRQASRDLYVYELGYKIQDALAS